MLPYKVVHIHENGHPFEVGASSKDKALEVAQIQLETHSYRSDRVGSLRGDGLVKYYSEGALSGQVEILVFIEGKWERAG